MTRIDLFFLRLLIEERAYPCTAVIASIHGGRLIERRDRRPS